MSYQKSDLTENFLSINDDHLTKVGNNWFLGNQKKVNRQEFLNTAVEWFKSTKNNNLIGWDNFEFVDATTGNTSYIESFYVKYGIDKFQILSPYEYAYYSLLGHQGVTVENLRENVPLVISIPNWYYGGIRPEWNDILKICEQKNIDIHLDMAWITLSKDIEIDFSHPCIKSFAMGTSKFTQPWLRAGVRFTKQRTIDNITILNHFYSDNNSALFSAGVYAMENIPRDYSWQTYGNRYNHICTELGVLPTNLINVVYDPEVGHPRGIAEMLTK